MAYQLTCTSTRRATSIHSPLLPRVNVFLNATVRLQRSGAHALNSMRSSHLTFNQAYHFRRPYCAPASRGNYQSLAKCDSSPYHSNLPKDSADCHLANEPGCLNELRVFNVLLMY